MTAKGKTDRRENTRPKTVGSKRFYWVFGTLVAGVAGFVLYYGFYVSSQQDYYDQRAFRLLAIMGDSVRNQVDRVANTLAASAGGQPEESAGRTRRPLLVGKVKQEPNEKVSPEDYLNNALKLIGQDPKPVRDYKKKSTYAQYPDTRDGSWTIFPPLYPNSLLLPLEYRQSRAATRQKEEVPCAENSVDSQAEFILVCATVDFDPLLRSLLAVLDENFFDDVLIADSSGEVLYQQSPSEDRIKNLDGLLPSDSKPGTNSGKDDSSGITGLARNLLASPPPGARLSALSEASREQDVNLAGTSYKMYVHPLAILLHGKQERSLIICGLRNQKRAQSQALSLPYTYMSWGVLLVLAFLALSWPILKLVYMSPKERLPTRQVLYLIFSVLFGTVLLTLIALNLSYKQISKDRSERDLQKLAERIKKNVTKELQDALGTLDAMTDDPDLLRYAGSNDWNFADFLKDHDLQKYNPVLSKFGAQPYPYFRYFFLADDEGKQQLKFTVNSSVTPRTRIASQDYFGDIMDDLSHEASERKLEKENSQAAEGEHHNHRNVKTGHSKSAFDRSLAVLPVPPGDRYRIQPLFSPNTGEFLVIIAAPYERKESKDPDLAHVPKNLTVKALSVKMESLVNPVLPAGFGYAIVDSGGNVQFHSIATRNLLENFIKESREDPAITALLTDRGSDAIEAMYMGTEKLLWVTPMEILGKPTLTLIAFRDSTYFTTLNVAILVAFLLLISFYASFIVAGVVIRMLCRPAYPLEAIWPDRHRTHQYLASFVANLFLTLTFFAGYTTFDADRVFRNVFVVAVTALLYCCLWARSRLAARLANLGLFLVLTTLVPWDLRVLFPVGFAVVVSSPTLAVLERWQQRRLQLKYVYTIQAASILVVLAVVPSCGFFKVSCDYVQQVFLQRQQLDLAGRLFERRYRVHEFFMHRNAPNLVDERWTSDLDRYDHAFLNSKYNATLQRGTSLQPSLLKYALAAITSGFPANDLGAELRELGLGEQPAYCCGNLPHNTTGDANPEHERERAATEVLWTLALEKDTATPLLAMTPVERKSGDAEEERTKEDADADRIVSVYPSWWAQSWRGRLLLLAAIGVVTLWIHFVTSRIFLANLHSAPPLERWDPADKDAKRLLILGHPKSGKGRNAVEVPGHQIVDVAEMVTTGNWKIPKPLNRVIVLDHFEFDIDNPASNTEKLRLLEYLTYVEHMHIVILSAIDPLYYLIAAGQEALCTEKQDSRFARQILDRWAAVLTPFSKREVEDANQRSLLRVLDRTRTRRKKNQPLLRFVDWVQSECNHTAQLRRLGKVIVHSYRDQPVAELTRERLLEELLDRGDAYYRALWSTCTADERLVLFQLARDGWANPMNELAIQQLLRRGLIRRAPGLRLMNDSFHRFINNSQQGDEVAVWKQEGEQSVWRSLKLVLLLLGGLTVAWLVYAQQQFFNAAIGYIGAIGAATGVVIKLIGDVRAKASTKADAGS
jgi:hypothetical protein